MTPTPARPGLPTPTREERKFIEWLAEEPLASEVGPEFDRDANYKAAYEKIVTEARALKQHPTSEPAGPDLASIKLGAYYEDIEAALKRVIQRCTFINEKGIAEVMEAIFGDREPEPAASVPVPGAVEIVLKVPVRFVDDPNGGLTDELPVYMPRHQAENIVRALQDAGLLAAGTGAQGEKTKENANEH